MSAIPIAVLTNGTLFYQPDVREELKLADLVLPSLDAVSEDVFRKINQPHEQIKIKNVIKGLQQFSREYQGEIWLEVFMVKGINDSEAELDLLHQVIKSIAPARVQLNSLDRPPAFSQVQSIAIQDLESIRNKWSDLQVDIIKRVKQRKEIASFSKNLENNILNTIIRRPLTIDDLIHITGKNRLEIYKYIDVLEKEKKVYAQILDDKIFYRSTKKQPLESSSV